MTSAAVFTILSVRLAPISRTDGRRRLAVSTTRGSATTAAAELLARGTDGGRSGDTDGVARCGEENRDVPSVAGPARLRAWGDWAGERLDMV